MSSSAFVYFIKRKSCHGLYVYTFFPEPQSIWIDWSCPSATQFSFLYPYSHQSSAVWQPGCAHPSHGCSPRGRGCGSLAPMWGASVAPGLEWQILPRGGRSWASCGARPRLSWRYRSGHWREGVKEGKQSWRRGKEKSHKCKIGAAETAMGL